MFVLKKHRVRRRTSDFANLSDKATVKHRQIGRGAEAESLNHVISEKPGNIRKQKGALQ